jgi:hypothetical protein|tara:strand:+ start:2580 stop:2843 length:264 start_codon:yes stop_codon:yes gene_type:complete
MIQHQRKLYLMTENFGGLILQDWRLLVRVGDLVTLKDGVHEAGMPKNRNAVVVEEINDNGEYTIMFFGSDKTYRFNKYFIVPIQKVD